MITHPNPTVARRRLAVFLSSVREQHKRSLPDVAKRLGVALSQASRLDTGARGYRVEDVRKLVGWYGLDETTERSLLALAEESRRRAWWQQVDLSDSYRTMIGMEQAAIGINEYCSSVIPGLLQTEEFATAAVEATAYRATAEQVRTAVDVRLRRQEVLARSPAPNLKVIVDEAALARVTGGPRVMREQLQHLLVMSERPDVRIQVIGFDFGLHPGSENHFIILEMPDLPHVAYSDHPDRPADTSDEIRLQNYRGMWEELTSTALDPRRSRQVITGYVNRLPLP